MASRHDYANGRIAAALFLCMFLVYNANGREIPSLDSQPTKYAARELLLRGTMTLNHVVGATPQLLERAPFVAAADGNYRSAYSPTPVLLAAGLMWPLYATGLLDIRAPLAPALIAKIAASFLAATAVALLFLTSLQWASRTGALLVASGAGIGTGYWNTISQTLWQHESAAAGLALAVWAFSRPSSLLTASASILVGLGLGVAATARPQLSVAAVVLLAGMFARTRLKHASSAAAVVTLFALALVAANIRWFDHPLGAIPQLESVHPSIHAAEGSFQIGVSGLAGLLLSPNRGILVYSPLVLVPIAGLPLVVKAGTRSAPWWCSVAALAQYLAYGCYTVWWGGHTYGPRYMLDVVPLLVPAAALVVGTTYVQRGRAPLAALAFAWSVAVAAAGAFCYPNERWNVEPVDVDRHHRRLWNWSDLQIVRCWQRGFDPRNFTLLDRAAISLPEPDDPS